jgi:hypothetical protein
MASIKLVGSKTIKMSDFSEFLPEDNGFNLVDIVNDASLEKPEDTFITAPGSFTYELTLDIDMKRAAELDVESVLVEVFRDNPIVPKPANKNLSTRAKDAKSSFNTTKELIENNQNKAVATGLISLNINSLVRRAASSATTIPAELIFNEKLRLDVPVACQNNSYATPIAVKPMPVAMMGTITNSTSQSARTIKQDNLRRFGVDPVTTNNVTLPLYPTLSSLSKNAMTSLASGGIVTQAPSLNPRHFNGARISLQELRSRLQPKVLNDSLASKSIALAVAAGQSDTGLLKSKQIKLPNNVVVKNDNSLQVLAHEINVQSTIKTMKSIIEVPKENIGDKNFVYVRLTPRLMPASRTAVTLSHVHAIQHKVQVEQMMMPVFAPKIEKIREERGRVSFRITQIDPASTSIVVMKKVVTKGLRDDNRLEILGDYKLEYHDKSIIVEDNNTSNFEPNNVIYRAITKYNDLSGPFESLVFAGLSNPYIEGISHEPEDISIVATNENEWIKIEVSGIPERAVSIRLKREDLQGPGLSKNRTTTIRNEQEEHTTFVLDDNNEVTFYDRNTIKGRKYRYYCILTMQGGSQITSYEDELIIRNFSNEQIPLKASLNNLEVILLPNGKYSTKMNLNVEFKDNTFQFIRSILQQQGSDESFIKEIESNRDEIKNMVLFRVERLDRYTGKRVNLGTHKPGIFADDEKLAADYKIASLEPGRRYLYLFKVCLVPPSAFLSGVFNNLSSGKLLGEKDIKYLANKYENPVIKKKGTLPSNAQLTKGFDAELLIIQGDTGLTLQQEVILPESRPIAKDVNYKLTSRGNIVTWQISDGDVTKIEAFNIKVYNNSGVPISLPSVAYGRTKGMYFIDNQYNNELGTMYYAISTVYNDNTESAEAVSAPIIKKADSLHILRKVDKPDTLVIGTNIVNPTASKNLFLIGDYKNSILN